ncbi:unnamed protein product [Ectocarpus sp. 4 AP-2014]
MLGNETLWEAAQKTHAVLAAAGVPHAILGGVAVCLHGYQRNTADVDLVIQTEDRQHREGRVDRRWFRLGRVEPRVSYRERYRGAIRHHRNEGRHQDLGPAPRSGRRRGSHTARRPAGPNARPADRVEARLRPRQPPPHPPRLRRCGRTDR